MPSTQTLVRTTCTRSLWAGTSQSTAGAGATYSVTGARGVPACTPISITAALRQLWCSAVIITILTEACSCLHQALIRLSRRRTAEPRAAMKRPPAWVSTKEVTQKATLVPKRLVVVVVVEWSIILKDFCWRSKLQRKKKTSFSSVKMCVLFHIQMKVVTFPRKKRRDPQIGW